MPVQDQKDPLGSVLTYLEGRTHIVSASLANIDAANKKQEAEMRSTVEKSMPVQDQKDPLVKAQGVIKMFMKKQHRQFEKARLPFQNELKELHQAETAINKGDAAGLSQVIGHMQSEMKMLQAKSHKFLY